MSLSNPPSPPSGTDNTGARLYIDLENSFLSFLREDPTRTTSVPATMAAQHFEARIERYIEQKIAQEANKARIDELNKLPVLQNNTERLVTHVWNRIAQLTADKEQADE